MRKICVITYTENGKKLFGRLSEAFTSDVEFLSIKDDELKQSWKEAYAIIFICAAGIAVRKIAPLLEDKLSDPAVLVIDELGMNVIPILSGHVGGANELSRQIETSLGIRAVITTATDINGVISIDEWAVNNDLKIEDKAGIKKVSMKLLQGEEANVFLAGDVIVSNNDTDKEACDLWLSFKRQMVVGIGCKKETPFQKLKELFESTLDELKVTKDEVAAFASIDLKIEEEGLLELSDTYGIPFYFYSAEELKSVPGDFEASEFVEKVTGVSDVSARAAKCFGKNGNFILKKKKIDGMTISVFEIYKVIKIINEKD